MAVDVHAAFAPWRATHARRAWKPVCTEGDGPGPRFGGTALLAAGEAWPTCTGCSAPMQLFVQIPLASLPPAFAARGEGILQLFYCSTDDGGCPTWEPFSGAHVVRLLTAPALPAAHPAGLAPLPARSITGWTERVDHPGPAEHEELGIHYEYDFDNDRVTITCKEPGITLRDVPSDGAAEAISVAEPGDKLGGWPVWIQGVEYPSCPECSARMALVLQVDSEDNVPHMFGDAGCGHITQCPAHPAVLAFAWACS